MARTEYQQQLTNLRAAVVEMGETVQKRLAMALDALNRKDDMLAEEVIVRDHEINDQYLQLERECIELIARQQPVAGDLRFIAASFKIITDLERIADLATNIGKYTLQAEANVHPDVDIQRIGAVAKAMVMSAITAFGSEDVAACYELDRRDDELDDLCSTATQRVVEDLLIRDATSKPEEVDVVLTEVSRLLLTIRDLERVGDHAVNIAARTVYMVENDPKLIY